MAFSYYADPASNSGVGVCFTDRIGGYSTCGAASGFNLGRTDVDDVDALRATMGMVRARIKVNAVCALHQVHGTSVYRASDPDRWSQDAWLGDVITDPATGNPQSRLPIADASITDKAGVALMIRVADCVPIVLADRHARVIGAVHAGRRGLLAGVIQAAVEQMAQLGARHLHAWIGPRIPASAYEVPQNMADDAWDILPACRALSAQGTPAIDLGAGARSILEDQQVSVTDTELFTTDKRFYSHRGDGPKTGRQAGFIWLAG